MSPTEFAKICYLWSRSSFCSQHTCTCLKILLLGRRRRGAQSWQHNTQRLLSLHSCFLLSHLFTGTTGFFQWDWGTAGRKFSVNTSFWCQTGFSNKQKRSGKNFIFLLKTQVSQRSLTSEVPTLWGWIIFRLGEKCFFRLVEENILLVSI